MKTQVAFSFNQSDHRVMKVMYKLSTHVDKMSSDYMSSDDDYVHIIAVMCSYCVS